MECARYPRPPVLGYLLIAAAWLLAIAGLELADRVRALGLLDLVVLGLATHQLSRVLTKERIAYPVRRLFTEPDGDTPRAGWAMAPGQLVTCPYCASVWSATLLVALQAAALTTVLALAGAASLAHAWRDRETP
jgi:Protein of unknown function (DUF1360)